MHDKIALARIKSLQDHLADENPLLNTVVDKFVELDKIGMGLGVLSDRDSYTNEISWWPLISILGTFSAGKSSFINQYIGNTIQKTGNQAVDDKQRMGCLLVNSAMELAGQDDAVAIRAQEAVQVFENKFHRLLYQAQLSGELNTTRDLREIAQYLTNAVFGLRVLAKMNPDRQVLTNVVNLTLSTLD